MYNVTEDIEYVGVDDKTLDLFESQYVIPNGISYNSYLIKDEKITLMDTVDARKLNDWYSNIEKALNGKEIDYLVISHLEPDHSAGVKLLMDKYKNMKLVGNKKTFAMLPQFFDIDCADRQVIVEDGQKLNIGRHTLEFFMAPMIHWPEVMMTYDEIHKVLFTADAFGKFGALDTDEEWTCEARRYYFNIVGKYGTQVQMLLKKLASVDINIICPLHGPILTKNLDFYINKYDVWSSYMPEDDGVLIAYNSIHGNTKNAVLKLSEILKEKGAKRVVISDLARDDMAEAIEDAFRYDKLIIASPTYDAGLFPYTEKFLWHLKHKNFQNRKIAIIENGSWAPMSGKLIKSIAYEMKDITVIEPMVTIRTTMDESNLQQLNELAKNIL